MKYRYLAMTFMLMPTLSQTMSEEEQMKKAMELSLQEDPALQAVLKESEQTAQDEKARILPAGVYQRVIDGYAVQQLALADEDRQSGENITCGPKVLFIAKGLTNIVKTKQPINQMTMNDELKKLRYGTKTTQEVCKNKQLEAGLFERYMEKHKLSVPSFFALGAQGNTREGLQVIPLDTNVNPQKEVSEEDLFNTLTSEDLSNQLTKTIAPYLGKAKLNPIHFFCDDARAGHWFLISVVKNNDEFNIWYIDPKNVDVNLYPYAHTFIPYIYDNLIDKALAITRARQSATSSFKTIDKPVDPNAQKK